MLWISRHKNRRFDARYDHPYEKFAGFIKIMPVGAVIMAIFMLSLAGVPPFSIFWGKLYIMQAAVNFRICMAGHCDGIKCGSCSILLCKADRIHVP